ncbi:MAG: hypothetical protein CMJ18_25300 [Phycisphaeraceae bacterium]|nr:hypothetical protein [Phycisphaeraceae bacterium]
MRGAFVEGRRIVSHCFVGQLSSFRATPVRATIGRRVAGASRIDARQPFDRGRGVGQAEHRWEMSIECLGV